MTVSAPIVITYGAGGFSTLRCRLTPASGSFVLGTSQESEQACAVGNYSNAQMTDAGKRLTPGGVLFTDSAKLFGVKAEARGLCTPCPFGTIQADSLRAVTDCYYVSPPCLDACFHLGVVDPELQGAKIPVAIGALAETNFGKTISKAPLYGTCVPETTSGKRERDISVSSFAIVSGPGICCFNGLKTKIVQAKKAVTETNEQVQFQNLRGCTADYLYEVQQRSVGTVTACDMNALQPHRLRTGLLSLAARNDKGEEVVDAGIQTSVG